MSVSKSDSDEFAPIFSSAGPEDLPDLGRLDRLCFEPGIAYSQRELRRFLAIPGAESVLARADGELAGFAIGYLGSSDLARIVALDVDPSFRRRGLGQKLLEALLGRLSASGATRALLEVDVRNSGAIAFYRKLEFEESGRLPSYYGPGLDAFEMGRKIAD
ncbi:MAG TPA: GNAT family N-acetyltransferase [Thermoanaerobaculia bacterium]